MPDSQVNNVSFVTERQGSSTMSEEVLYIEKGGFLLQHWGHYSIDMFRTVIKASFHTISIFIGNRHWGTTGPSSDLVYMQFGNQLVLRRYQVLSVFRNHGAKDAGKDATAKII